MLVALNTIEPQKAAPTQKTMEKVKQLLNYCASQEGVIITYHASDMVLTVQSDAGYLNEIRAGSRVRGHFLQSSNGKIPPNTWAVLTVAQIIDAVMSSAAEAEVGALFINAKKLCTFDKSCRRWNIPNIKRQSKRTTQQPKVSLFPEPNQSKPR